MEKRLEGIVGQNEVHEGLSEACTCPSLNFKYAI